MHQLVPHVSPLFNPNLLKDLEDDLVAAIYEQRRQEEELAAYRPASKAPAELRERFFASKRAVQDLEIRIRRVRHAY